MWTRLLRTSHDSKIETQTLDATRASSSPPTASWSSRVRGAREFIHSSMGGRVRRRAGTMDPPPSTSRADEGRGEGTREENDDENEKDDGRSVEDSRVCIRMDCRVGTSTGRGGDT